MNKFIYTLLFVVIAESIWGQITCSITLNQAPTPSVSSLPNNNIVVTGTVVGGLINSGARRGFVISQDVNFLISPTTISATSTTYWSSNNYNNLNNQGFASWTGTTGVTNISNYQISLYTQGIYYIRTFYKSGTSAPVYSDPIAVHFIPNFIGVANGVVPTPQIFQICSDQTYNTYPTSYTLPSNTTYVTYEKKVYSDANATVPISNINSVITSGETFYVGLKITYADIPTTTVNEANVVEGPIREYTVELYQKPVINTATLPQLSVISPSNQIDIQLGGQFEVGFLYFTNDSTVTPEDMTLGPNSVSTYYHELYDNGGSTTFQYSDFVLPTGPVGGGAETLTPGETKYLYLALYGACFLDYPNYFDDIFLEVTRISPPVIPAAFDTLLFCNSATVGDLKSFVESTIYNNSGETWEIYSAYDTSNLLSGTIMSPTENLNLYMAENAIQSFYVSYIDQNGNESDTKTEVNIVLSDWQGPVSGGNVLDTANWCSGTIPTEPQIPPGTTAYIDGSYNFTNITVECGGALVITETGRVNITNVLTNGGLVHVINGGTIHYGSTVSGTCTGTYQTTETFSPSRYWYVGPTTTTTVRADFGTVASAQNTNGTQMWSWNELSNSTSNNYTAPVYSSGNLIPGNGYVYRNLGSTNMVVNTSGPFVTSPITRTGLTRTGTGTMAGYHLLSNPYTAYLDLTEVFSATNLGTSNLLPTIWVRSNSASNGNAASMVFDTYNAQSGIGTGLGWQTAVLNGNPGGINSLMRWVAPMQGFWVRVNSGASTGNIAFDYSMASANPIGAGQLRTTSPIEALARINVQFGDQKDQFIAALSASAQNGFDAFDSEKMFTSGVVQAYTPNSGKKLVINTLKNNKSKVSMPVTVECPANGWYSFELLELQLEAGVLLLEDKLEGIMHDLTLDTSYQFYANSGVLSNRFVLHFNIPLATSNPTGPSSIEDLVSESQNAQIEINANATGKVTVELSQANESTSSFVRIVDINGKVLESFTGDGLSFDFQISQGQGIYIVEVSNGLSTEKKKVFIQ